MDPKTTTNFVIPEVVSSHFHLKDGDVMADFGAGSGYFLRALSLRVGSGKVYACEIQKNLVEKVSDQVRAQGLSNVYPLWCDLEERGGVPIKDNALDVGLLVNTLFQLEDKTAVCAEIYRLLRPGGRLIVIDWTDSHGGLGPAPEHVCDENSAKHLFESASFVLEQAFPAGAHHYGLAFRKI
ncbi:MAG: methyltransferase domain-containing protein [Patescibacteria group bacterium]